MIFLVYAGLIYHHHDTHHYITMLNAQQNESVFWSKIILSFATYLSVSQAKYSMYTLYSFPLFINIH